MIPTLLVLGAMAGVLPRGWMFIVVAAVAWPLLLWLSSTGDGGTGMVETSALAAVNAAIGVAAGLPFRYLATRIIGRLER